MRRLLQSTTGQRFIRNAVAAGTLALTLLLAWGCQVELRRPDLQALESVSDEPASQTDGSQGGEQSEQCFEEVGARTSPPSGGHWEFYFPDPGVQQCSYFRLLSEEEAGPGHPHTLVAELAGYDDQASGSLHHDAVLNALAEGIQSQWNSDRFQILAIETIENSLQSATCVEYQATVEDRGVPGFSNEVFEMKVIGRRCQHPQDPTRIVDASYSQRFRQGGIWLHLADAAMEPFLSDLEFLPRVP